MRSLATRTENAALSPTLKDIVNHVRSEAFDLVFIESAGVGQSDTSITELVNFSIYVMTPEYGAATQLEKIAMLDFADMVIINKFDRMRAEDALQQVKKQYLRNHAPGDTRSAVAPVYPTIANRFGDKLVDDAFAALIIHLKAKQLLPDSLPSPQKTESISLVDDFIPAKRSRYLSDIADAVRGYHTDADTQAELAQRAQALFTSMRLLGYSKSRLGEIAEANDAEPLNSLVSKYNETLAKVHPTLLASLAAIETTRTNYAQEKFSYKVRGKDVTVRAGVRSLSNTLTAKVSPAPYKDWGELSTFLLKENIPGEFPFTAGVFPFKREGEDPTRMFAGEGSPERTNRRFHLIAGGPEAKPSSTRDASVARLSTAFDSITLYGENPDERPDIFGKIGNAGVSICTVDDIKKLYSGFDLSAPTTSVSMTINGPSPTILAFFMNAAIDQKIEQYLHATGNLETTRAHIADNYRGKNLPVPVYGDALPETHNGLGLSLLG
ncbi:MAG TPA: methylmalonyl-CoA mutase family protein, partial [Turneriella sp.]|nr:methylmalonyl-CoA mutase family protein [Turneriella sp.]